MESTITWIDVNDEMPNKSDWYLVTYCGAVGESYYNRKCKKWLVRESDIELVTVTAWAKMPKPYKK